MVKNAKVVSLEDLFEEELAIQPKKTKNKPTLTNLPTFTSAKPRKPRTSLQGPPKKRKSFSAPPLLQPLENFGSSTSRVAIVGKSRTAPFSLKAPTQKQKIQGLTNQQQNSLRAQRSITIASSYRAKERDELSAMTETEHRAHLEQQLCSLYHLVEFGFSRANPDGKEQKKTFCKSPTGKRELHKVYLNFVKAGDAKSIYVPVFSHGEDLEIFSEAILEKKKIPYHRRFVNEKAVYMDKITSNRDSHDQAKVKAVKGRMLHYDRAIASVSGTMMKSWPINLPNVGDAWVQFSSQVSKKMGVDDAITDIWTKRGVEVNDNVRESFPLILEAVASRENKCLRTAFRSIYVKAKTVHGMKNPNTLPNDLSFDLDRQSDEEWSDWRDL